MRLSLASNHNLNELFVAFLIAAVCHVESIVTVVTAVTFSDSSASGNAVLVLPPPLFLLSSNDMSLLSGDPLDVLEIAHKNFDTVHDRRL